MKKISYSHAKARERRTQPPGKGVSPGRGFGRKVTEYKQSSDIPPTDPTERRKRLIEAVTRTESIEDDETRIQAVEAAIAQYADPTDRKAWGAALQIATILFLRNREAPPDWLLARQRKIAPLLNGKKEVV